MALLFTPQEITKILDSLRRNVIEAVDNAYYMDIITATSDNIGAKIGFDYTNRADAISARSGTDIAVQVEDKEVKREKKDDELKAEIIARTWIALDGDIALILPKKINQIDSEVLQLHKANVDVAVQNWRYFMATMVQVLKMVSELAK